MPFKDARAARMYKTQWKREKYYQEHNALIDDMGGKCVLCGGVDRLELDHKGGWRQYSLTLPGSLNRIRKYRQEWEAWLAGTGPEVRLLCKRCNLSEMHDRVYSRPDEVGAIAAQAADLEAVPF